MLDRNFKVVPAEHAVFNYKLASVEPGRLEDAVEYFTRSAGYFKDTLDVIDALMGMGNSRAKNDEFIEAVLSCQRSG